MNRPILLISALLLVPAAGLRAQTSVENVNYASGQTLTVSDPVSIAVSLTGSGVTVSSGANITYATGGTITLYSGFIAASGSTFLAYLPLAAPGNLAATSWGPTSASFSWSASTDSVAVTGYQVLRNGTLLTILGPSTLSFADSTVVSGSTYTYSVFATDVLGNDSPASTLTITATNPPPGSWDTEYFGTTSINPNADYNGSGYTVAQDYLLGYNPTDYFNGRAFAILDSGRGNTFSYDLSGRLIETTYSNGINDTLTNDSNSNLTGVANYGPIVAWRISKSLPPDGTGIGADSAVLAGDEIPNLGKYAFGLNPTTAVTGSCPVVSLTSLSGGYLELTYTRPDPAPADIIYTVQVSPDGINWTSGTGATVNISSVVASGIATVVVRDATAIGSATFGRLIRLSIQRMPQP